jgi:type II secretory pathway component PulM
MKPSLATIVNAASTPQFRQRALVAWRVAVLVLLAVLIYQVQEVSDDVDSNRSTLSQMDDLASSLHQLNREIDSVKAEIDGLSMQILMMRR